MAKKKILFIDRDGTLIKEPVTDYQVDRLEKFEFIPGVISALRKIVEETDYELVMVSNQDGLGTPAFPEEDFIPYQQLLVKTLEGEGVFFREILIDRSFPEDNSPYRKPGTGMVEKYMNEFLDKDNSYVIGDRMTDMALAVNMGVRGIFFGEADVLDEGMALASGVWNEIFRFLKSGGRKSSISRETLETGVHVRLNIDGEGRSRICTGLAFFDHMLDQVARHGKVDLDIEAKGDLEVDEHHLIEDTGIVLGQCFHEALGSRRGIERYAFALPMDEAGATVLLDLGGRSFFVWEVDLKREFVGDFPTEMAKHFFYAFCQGAKCTLHITAGGENTHHVLEGVFKAFACCIRTAVRQTSIAVPSSKGVL